MSRVPRRGEAVARPLLDVRLAESFEAARKVQPPCVRCTRRTREGKPFCSDHLDESSYVAGLLADPRRTSGARAASD